jgi:hypothetical protein
MEACSGGGACGVMEVWSRRRRDSLWRVWWRQVMGLCFEQVTHVRGCGAVQVKYLC